MQTGSVAKTGLAAALIALSLIAGGLADARATEPQTSMTDEDVVRLYVSGIGSAEIIERIRDSAVAFDLSEEMLAELRAAALPEPLIQAMIERQREWDAEHAAPEEPVENESPPVPRLRLRLNPAEGSEGRTGPVLRVIDVIDRPTYEALRLRGEAPRFTDAALVLACRTADHVPDHWRGKTPLGRDFVNAPRHRLLAFLPGATRREAGELRELAMNLALPPGEREGRPEPGLLELELPPVIEVELEPDLVHDLLLGVALQTEERYYLIRSDTWEGFVLPEEGLSIDARITGGRGGDTASIKVRFERTPPPGG